MTFITINLNSSVNRGVLTGFILKVFTTISPLILLPLFLKQIGADIFGVWMTALSIVAMLASLDLGVGNAIITLLPKYLANKENYRAIRLLKSAYILLGCVAIGLIISLTIYLIFSKDVYKFLFYIIIVIYAISLPSNLIIKILISNQESSKSNILQAISTVFTLIICYLLFINNKNDLLLIGAYTSIPVFINLIYTIIFFRKNFTYRDNYDKLIKRQELKELLKFGMGFTGLTAILAVVMNMDTLIVERYYGLENVAQFSLVGKIGALLTSMVSLVSFPLWADIAKSFALGEYSYIKYVTKKYSFFMSVFYLVISVPIIIYSSDILYYWTELKIRNVELLMFGFCLLPTLMMWITPYFMILNSLGKIKIQCIVFLIYFLISLLIKLYVADKYEIYWISIIGSILYMIIVIPIIYLVSKNEISPK
jgi:O-antigen/teichoic acid export membrane protein